MSRASRASTVHLPDLPVPPATLLDGLVARFPRVPRAVWRERLDAGRVRDLDGHPLAADAAYRAGLGVRYFREVEDEPEPAGELRLVHLDDRLVVVDKPPFVPVTPTGPWLRRSLLERLERELGLGGVAPVHRLDRATSGLVVLARRSEDRGAYAGLFAERQVEKLYDALALCPERPAERRFRIAGRIVPGEPFFRMREVEGEANAETDLELVAWQGGVGRFELRPRTGRKHQLRLHLARLGWPILGDRWYPRLLPATEDDPREPLRLVARQLAFRDPVDGRARVFESGFDVATLARDASPATDPRR